MARRRGEVSPGVGFTRGKFARCIVTVIVKRRGGNIGDTIHRLGLLLDCRAPSGGQRRLLFSKPTYMAIFGSRTRHVRFNFSPPGAHR